MVAMAYKTVEKVPFLMQLLQIHLRLLSRYHQADMMMISLEMMNYQMMMIIKIKKSSSKIMAPKKRIKHLQSQSSLRKLTRRILVI
jgi:hypothetical protein